MAVANNSAYAATIMAVKKFKKVQALGLGLSYKKITDGPKICFAINFSCFLLFFYLHVVTGRD
jgi:hypothetical protein